MSKIPRIGAQARRRRAPACYAPPTSMPDSWRHCPDVSRRTSGGAIPPIRGQPLESAVSEHQCPGKNATRSYLPSKYTAGLFPQSPQTLRKSSRGLTFSADTVRSSMSLLDADHWVCETLDGRFQPSRVQVPYRGAALGMSRILVALQRATV
jgi:hypothetical protein